MKDEEKTYPQNREQLIKELAELRRRVAELETSEAERRRAEEALQHSLEKTAYSRRLLLALGQAAQAVQRARTTEELYRTVGDEVAKLGHYAIVFTLTAGRTHLTISHLTFESTPLQMAEKLVGLSAEDYQFAVEPGSIYDQVIAEGRTIFSEQVVEGIVSAIPKPMRPLAGQIATTLGLEQAIYAPLTVGGEAYGLLGVTGTGLTESDIPAVTAFANQTAVALENTQLYEELRHRAVELERRVAELSALNAMATIVNESLDVDEILNRAIDEALQQIGVEAAGILLLNAEAAELVLVAHRGVSDEFVHAVSRLRLDEAKLAGQAVGRGEPVVISRIAEYPGMLQAFLEKERIQSIASIPLLGSTKVIGAMNLGTANPHFFDPAGLDLLVNLGRQIAIGVEKAQLYERVQGHTVELEQRVAERTRELREAQDQLVRQEKLAILGQLAGGIAHELRNPVGAIKNAAYFLSLALEAPEPEVQETLEILEKEVGTSERIIQGLLNFARTRPPTKRQVNINDVVQEALSHAHAAVPENIKVVSHLAESLPPILADPDQLGQVFENIIRNAIQAMPEGGSLVIKSEAPEPEWVTVSFSDDGAGIAEENLEKLFEPLFTTKAKGIGLGLALTKTLVEAHKGTIEVQSKIGKGSTFTVRLFVNRKLAPSAAEKDQSE